MPYTKNFDMVIGALESVPGVAETLAQADRNICFVGGSIEYSPTVDIDDEGSKCANGEHGENESITGNQYATLNFEYKYRWGGAVATAPNISKFMQGCGLKEIAHTTTGISWEPMLEKDLTTMTISYYQRERGGTYYKVHNLSGCMGNAVLTCDNTGAPLKIQFAFQGKVESVTDVASGSIPTEGTFDTATPEKFLNSALTVYGNSLKVSTFSLDIGNDIQPEFYASDSTGIDYYFIASRQPRITMNPLDERVSVFDTYSTLKDMTTGAISIPFGTNHMVIKAPKVQLLNYSKGDREGLVSNEITFKLLKNGTTDATIESEATFQLLQGATA